ncbi:hypothetical protein [Pedobacter sp.]
MNLIIKLDLSSLYLLIEMNVACTGNAKNYNVSNVSRKTFLYLQQQAIPVNFIIENIFGSLGFFLCL